MEKVLQMTKGCLNVVARTLSLLLGLALVYFGIEGLRANSSTWPSVEGRVSASVLQPVYSEDGTSTRDEYKIIYEYRVGADQYSGSFISVSAYPAGESVSVYYDPANPGSSIRTPGEMEWTGFGLLAAGLLCLGWVGQGLYQARRPKMNVIPKS